MFELATANLRVDEDGWLYRLAAPDDDDGDDEFIGDIEDAYCVPDELDGEYETLCDAWRRDVGAMRRDIDEHRDRRYAR